MSAQELRVIRVAAWDRALEEIEQSDEMVKYKHGRVTNIVLVA